MAAIALFSRVIGKEAIGLSIHLLVTKEYNLL